MCIKQCIGREHESLDIYIYSLYLHVCFKLKSLTGITPVLLKLVSTGISDNFKILTFIFLCYSQSVV